MANEDDKKTKPTQSGFIKIGGVTARPTQQGKIEESTGAGPGRTDSLGVRTTSQTGPELGAGRKLLKTYEAAPPLTSETPTNKKTTKK